VRAAAQVTAAPLGAKAALITAGALAVLLGAALPLAALATIAAGEASSDTVCTPAGGNSAGQAPARFRPLYAAAAKKYRLGGRGAAILASIHETETGFGQNQGPSSAGAVGHMQFMPATWAMYGVDADGDGRKDPANPKDAIFAAARYLQASGAPGSWYRAIFAYNRAGWYVAKILRGARAYGGAAFAQTCEAKTDPGVSLGDLDFNDTAGAWGGARKFARALAAQGRRYGCVSTSEKRPRKSTASGGVSDHWVGSTVSYAVDIDSPGCTMTYPGGEADRTARAIARAVGMPSHTGFVSTVRGAYRFQLIWQAAGHYNHPHIGVKRVGR